MNNREKLVILASQKKPNGYLGEDFTNDNRVPDEVSCAYATTSLLNKIDPRIPIIDGTYQLDLYLSRSPLFERIYEPEAGAIVMAATGTNSKPYIIKTGHVGIYIDATRICSNSSATGLWTQNYTRLTWRERYYYQGGFPIKLYRLKVEGDTLMGSKVSLKNNEFNDMERNLGAWGSSANPAEVSLTIQSAVKILGLLIGAFASMKGLGVVIDAEQMEAVANSLVAIFTSICVVWQSAQVVYGIFRKILFKFYA